MNITHFEMDMTPQVCSNCGLTWRGVHQCVPDLRREIAELKLIMTGMQRGADSLRAECDRLAARVAELEKALKLEKALRMADLSAFRNRP